MTNGILIWTLSGSRLTLSEQVQADMEERWRTVTAFIMGVQFSRTDAQSES